MAQTEPVPAQDVTLPDEQREGVLALAGDAIAAEVGGPSRREGAPGAIRAWAFQPDGDPRNVSLAEVEGLINADENLVWVDLSRYSREQLDAVASSTHVEPAIVRTLLAPWQRPRVRAADLGFLVTVTVAELEPKAKRVIARQLDLLVGNNVLVSIHKHPLHFEDKILERASTDPDLIRLDSSFMLYIVLDELLDYYESLDEVMRGEVEEMQTQALHENSEEFLAALLQFKRYSFALTQLVIQHEAIFQAFLRPDFPFISGDEVSGYFRDLEERLHRLVDRLSSMRQEVNNTFDVYLSHQSQRTNDVMKALTMVATVLFTATFVEGIFSPAFHGIPTHSTWGFVAMLTLIGLLTFLALFVFRRRGWM